MPAAFFIALSLVVSGACAALSFRYPARARGVTTGDAAARARSLRVVPRAERARALLRGTPPDSWEHRLAQAILEAEGAPARIAAANDLLAEAARRLDAPAGWPAAATRLSALAALLLATLSFLARAGASAVFVILAAGAAGALASAVAGRRGRAEAARQREAIDALVAATLGPLDSGADNPGDARPRARPPAKTRRRRG